MNIGNPVAVSDLPIFFFSFSSQSLFRQVKEKGREREREGGVIKGGEETMQTLLCVRAMERGERERRRRGEGKGKKISFTYAAKRRRRRSVKARREEGDES